MIGLSINSQLRLDVRSTMLKIKSKTISLSKRGSISPKMTLKRSAWITTKTTSASIFPMKKDRFLRCPQTLITRTWRFSLRTTSNYLRISGNWLSRTKSITIKSASTTIWHISTISRGRPSPCGRLWFPQTPTIQITWCLWWEILILVTL